MRNNIILSLLGTMLLSLGWLEVSGITLLCALVPLLFISQKLSDSKKDWWKMFGYASLSLGLWSGITTWWIWYAAEIGAILSVIITVLLFGGSFMLYHYVSKRAPKSLAYTILVTCWISMEMLYTYGDVSFPWLMLGNGFANDIKLVQWYEYTGIFGGTLWVLLCNILIFETIIKRVEYSSNTHRAVLSRYIVTALFIFVPMIASVVMFYNYEEIGEDITVQVIQPNIDPFTEKFKIGQIEQNSVMLSLAKESPKDVDFIVMPETAIGLVEEGQMDMNSNISQYRDFLVENYPQAEIIVGALSRRVYNRGDKVSETARGSGYNMYDVYNSALAIDTSDVVQIHHKSKLVVGAESMPYKTLVNLFKFLIVDLGGTTGQLGVDSVRRVFSSPVGVKLGTAICYESIYGSYFSEFARNGAQVMSVITNDGWWSDAIGYKHHMNYSRFRAVESRRSIVRSANTGISAIINQRGEVISKTEGWVKDSMSGTVKSCDKITFYTQAGDYLGRLSIYTLLLSLLYYTSYRVRRKSHLI